MPTDIPAVTPTSGFQGSIKQTVSQRVDAALAVVTSRLQTVETYSVPMSASVTKSASTVSYALVPKAGTITAVRFASPDAIASTLGTVVGTLETPTGTVVDGVDLEGDGSLQSLTLATGISLAVAAGDALTWTSTSDNGDETGGANALLLVDIAVS